MTPLPALVLTAGLGTRLRPLTHLRAKGAMPVNGETLAGRVARWLAGYGITDQIFNLHYRPASITAAIGDGRALGIRARYSWEDPVLGSAGGPRHALPLLTDGGRDTFLIVNGDTLTDVDLTGVIDAHQRSGARLTMALIPNPEPDKYGGVLVGDSGIVTGFSRRGAVRDSYHFIGVQVVRADVFADLADNVPDESVGRLYPEIMKRDPRAIHAFVSNAGFRDIGTPSDYLRTSVELSRAEGDRLVSGRAAVDATATLERTIVWDDVTVGAGARLTDCIVAGRANVRAGATYTGSIIIGVNGSTPTEGERLDGDLLVRPL